MKVAILAILRKIRSDTKMDIRPEWRWQDPFDDECYGVLLSDYIARYVSAVQLIDTVDGTPLEDHLEAASYTLRVGSSWYEAGSGMHRLATDEYIEIPPNGLVIVTVMERINIPYYMIARINLRVKQVYRGLLLGTGPQVDPGFQGFLNCPIHNLTSEVKRLKYGEKLATIDFEKTTKFPGKGFLKEDDLFARPPKGTDGRPMKVWGSEPRHRPLLDRDGILAMLPPGESVASGLTALSDRLRRVERVEDSLRELQLHTQEQLETFMRESIKDFQLHVNRWRFASFAGFGALLLVVIGMLFDIQGRLAEFVGPTDANTQLLERRLKAAEEEVISLKTQLAGDQTVSPPRTPFPTEAPGATSVP